MFIRKALLAFAGAALLALPLAALPENQDQLVDKYSTFAGSKENSTALVTGLRDGKEIKLTDGTTFTPPTKKMGYGNVDIALALTEASLKEKGITNPTSAQLEAGLMDILKMRADGQGWGQIANSLGFKLGEVMRSSKADSKGASADRGASRPEKPERPERPVRTK